MQKNDSNDHAPTEVAPSWTDSQLESTTQGSQVNPYDPTHSDPTDPLKVGVYDDNSLHSSGTLQPESSRRVWTSFAVTAVALFGCVAASGVMAVVAMIVVTGKISPSGLQETMESRLGFALMIVPSQIMLLLASVAAAKMSPVGFFDRLSLVKGKWPAWTWFAAAAAAPMVGLASSVVLGMFMTESESLKLLSDTFRTHCESGFLIPLALMIGITPAICEEILFRGYVQTRLTRALPPYKGILISSALFAVFHMDLVHSIAVFPLGLFLGYIVWRSGSLMPGILAHFVNNVVSVVGVAFAPENETDVLAAPAALVSLFILTTGIIGTVAIVYACLHYPEPSSTTAAPATDW